MGANITGTTTNAYGGAVSLSEDGLTVGVGEFGNSNNVYITLFNENFYLVNL